MADIPVEIGDALNRGRLETVTLVEWLAIDMVILLSNILPEVGLAEYTDRLVAQAHRVASCGVMCRLEKIGEVVYAVLKDHPHRTAIFESLATHTSDMVRVFAAYCVTADEKLCLADRFEIVRRFAADSAMSVRECAWSSCRKYIIADLSGAIRLFHDWVVDADPNIRRYAIEATRPRGVWTKHIPALKKDPTQCFSLLEPVRSDSSDYVRRSVGNWLNDAGKTSPDQVKRICKRWMAESSTQETSWIVKHALRHLLVPGD